MTYRELYEKAFYDLEHNKITLGEFCKTIEPLEKEIDAPTIGGWIPCSERLPAKEKKTYWVCTDTECQCECRWTNNRFGITSSDEWGWSIFDIPQYTDVVAWMPLPKPYKR